MKGSHGLLLVALILLVSVGCWGGNEKKTARLEGAGSSFVDPMMQEWASIYKEKGVQVNYQSKGSSSGIRMMTGKEVNFGCSDAPMNEEQLAKASSAGGEVLHIPLCMGAVVPAYNLPGFPDLTFSGKVLADIYLGKITSWDDPKIKELNPGQDLPKQDIAPAFRSDGSGTTYIFTDYLTKIDPEGWKPGRTTTLTLKVGTGQQNNSAVAGFVKITKGAIGYVELIYALKNDITFGKVLNSKGKAIKADLKSVTAAAASATIPEDLRYSITNADGEDAYPIAGTVWAVVYVKQPANKAETLKEFLTWITHEGQDHCKKLHYAPLPQVLVQKIEGKIKLIEAGK
jgi:phosphate transport system substrate-binding protein